MKICVVISATYVVYCLLGGTTAGNGTANTMNKDCFQDFKIMTDIALSLCSHISNGGEYDSHIGIKESENAKLRCIDFAIKQFIPPIDREDITYIALKLHGLNLKLYELAYYKNCFFPKKDLKKDIAPLKNICTKIREVFKNNATKADYTATYISDISKLKFNENSYSILYLIYEYKLYELVTICTDKASDLNDYLIRTVIKNT